MFIHDGPLLLEVVVGKNEDNVFPMIATGCLGRRSQTWAKSLLYEARYTISSSRKIVIGILKSDHLMLPKGSISNALDGHQRADLKESIGYHRSHAIRGKPDSSLFNQIEKIYDVIKSIYHEAWGLLGCIKKKSALYKIPCQGLDGGLEKIINSIMQNYSAEPEFVVLWAHGT